MTADQGLGTGLLADNLIFFVRALREAGLPLGPGAALRAIEGVEAVAIGSREDFRATLHALLVGRREETVLFDQAFDLFWRRRGLIEKMIAMMSPVAKPTSSRRNTAQAGATRVADALLKQSRDPDQAAPSLDLDARFSVSAQEILRSKDFAQMTAAEIARANAAIARLALPDDDRTIRRLGPDPRGERVDARRSFRLSMRAGGASIAIARRAPLVRQPPVVAICDISGSMSDYTRVFLHFLHRLSTRRPVHSFLFGTRLSNVTRALRARDIDAALAACSASVQDWSGGTRIAQSLHWFNKDWSRRVLGQGATVILFTDGLEREEASDLAAEMRRLKRSSRRLIWVNPLLRFGGFEAKALGIRAMLPFVDEFRPIHNLASMADLCAALGRERTGDADPRLWLRRAA